MGYPVLYIFNMFSVWESYSFHLSVVLQLMKALPVLQKQLDVLLDFDVSVTMRSCLE